MTTGLWPAPDPEDLAGHDLTDEQVAELLDRSTGHPGRTLLEPARLAGPIEQLGATSWPAPCRTGRSSARTEGPAQQLGLRRARDRPLADGVAPEQLVELLDQLGR